MDSDLLNIREAAEYLKQKVPTLRKWRVERRLPVYKIGRAVRFEKGDLDALIERACRRLMRVGNQFKEEASDHSSRANFPEERRVLSQGKRYHRADCKESRT